MIALLAILLSTAAHANPWNFEDLTQEDFEQMESHYIQQRINDGDKLRAKVHSFARKNGGLKEMQEWSEDDLENAPTNIDFSTNSGLSCLAAIYWDEIKCVKLK